MVSYLTNLLNEIKEIFLFFLDYVFGSIFDGCLTEPTLIMQIFLFSFCTMTCLGLLVDFLIDHNHLFSEYMKDSSDLYVRDRKQREKEADREAKYEARREKYRLQNKADFIEKQNIIKQTQKDIYFDKKSGYENIKPSYDIEKAIEKAENEPLVYHKKTKKE